MAPDGGPLGRSVHHDPASEAYAVTEQLGALRTGLWTRHVGIYDQGDVGDCTANGICGAVSTGRFHHHIRSQHTIQDVYHEETLLDGFGNPWPPNDRGSSGLAACKVAKARGWISEYRHAFSLADALAALQTGPVITGVDWYDSMDRPDSAGVVTITVGAQVRGGHATSMPRPSSPTTRGAPAGAYTARSSCPGTPGSNCSTSKATSPNQSRRGINAMFGKGEPVDPQILRLEADKAKIHAELGVLHQRREMARQDELRAWDNLDGAHANQTRIEREIAERLEAVISLQHEIADLIPPPRPPA